MLIFSPAGLPVGQILLPGRGAGRKRSLVGMAIRPGTHELAIVTGDDRPDGNATICRARTPY